MSRIGKNPIVIPQGVSVVINDNLVTVKGKLGELTQEFSEIGITMEDNTITLVRPSESISQRANHGLYRALINNMIIGVSKGLTKDLELVGVGYRASNQGQKLT